MRIFISGKITGLDSYMEHFDKAEKLLKEMGGDVINPAALMKDFPDGMPHEFYMNIAIPLLKECDCIYMLSNWKDSQGAREEFDFAKQNGINIMYENDEENAGIVLEQIDTLESMKSEYLRTDPRHDDLRFAITALKVLLEASEFDD